MKKICLFVLCAISLFFVTPVLADNNCYGQYGGCNPSLSIVVDKLVGRPDATITNGTNATYVDNLSVSDIRFKPSQLVFFKVKVKNTSTETLYDVTLKDTIPSYLTPLEGPGSYDSNSRVITYFIGNIAPGEEKVYYFKMKVLDQNQLPADKGLMCITNTAQASNTSVFDNDSSQLCIEKQVTGVVKTPSAGPELGLILLGLNLAGLGAGLIIKKQLV